MTFGLSILVTFNYYPKQKTNKKRYIIQPYRLKLQGFRNYIATILESYLGGMSIILSGLLWRHSVASVFHCEDLFLHWSSYFPGVNCWSHPIFYGAKYSSHHISSVLPGVNCLSHQIFYGANCSSHHVVSFFTGVNCFSHPV